tara:strand:+ start:1766 stop:2848 length:1083 start_codon:yes stop_codon:yes gene_type:complete
MNPNKVSGISIEHFKVTLPLSGLTLLVLIIALISLCVGPVKVSPSQVLGVLFSGIGLDSPWSFSQTEQLVVINIRMPRILLGILVGAGLAVSGALMQGLFRNPLADPGLVGASSGAALAAMTVIVLGDSVLAVLPPVFASGALAIGAFAGATLSVLIVYSIATRNGHTSVTTMLLTGIAVNALAGAAVGMFMFSSNDEQLRDFTFWSLGSLNGSTWGRLGIGSILLLIGILLAPLMANVLNALLLGENEARHLGIPLQRVKLFIVVLATLTGGAAVAVTGIIGFVGLVAPHLIRLTIGPDHRVLIVGSALLGSSLLLTADLFARTIKSPAELPIGVVTAFIGAPFFIWLITRNPNQSAWN